MPEAEVPNLIAVIPEIFLALAAMALLMLGVFQREGDADGSARLSRLTIRLGALALLLTLLLVVTIAARGPILSFGGMFIVDPFAIFFKILVLLSAALILIVSQDYLERHAIARFEYPVLVMLATCGMMMMISANDFLALYLGLETQSLALYVIASFHRDNVRSVEAGLKYFVLGALASGMLLYGVSLVYGYSGTTGFEAIGMVTAALHGGTPPVGLIVGLVFVIAGLAFKVSAVPFHMWTPDVYEGAPTPVTAFFSLAPKMAAIALLLRVMVEPFGDLLDQWRQIIVFISIASMALGAFAALGQTNIKRLMAYSSIGHVGYALIGLAVAGAGAEGGARALELREQGIQSVLIYMAIYLVMNLGAFACILCMRRREQMVEGIDDLAGLSRTNPMMALALAIFMFSMAGIPPLAGFFGKLYIFLAAMDAQYYTLAILGVLSSVVAAFYYLRIVKVMYFDAATEPLDHGFGPELRLVILASSVFIVLFFLYPEPVLSGAGAAAASLFPGG
jgi:NADH-quinone oxidoreductase subunit N